MHLNAKNFIPAAHIAINNPDLQAAVTRATSTAYNRRLATMFAAGAEHGEAMRQQAAEAKRRTLRNLPDLLEKAEANMLENGMQVFWAQDADEVRRLVLDIAREHGVKKVVKSKSMVSEEVMLNSVLEQNNIKVLETDLGEFIVQLSSDVPSHIVMPVIHKTKESIRDIFVAALDMPFTDDAQDMTAFARKHLRQAFLSAEMGISGGNFIIAETGTLCLVTNEGNGRMATSLPRIHVAIVGIEKLVETVEDYAALTQVLTRSATGQPITVYTHMINGPRREGESDGPEFVYVILVDNGRTNIYGTSYTEALACIRCGACLNGCPVYQTTGGHAYGSVYPGPIGAVISPLLFGMDDAKLLPHASSLCGTCKQVCPVDIDLPRMLLDLRHDQVVRRIDETRWRIGLKLWAIGNRSPRLFELGGKAARFGRNLVFRNKLPGPLGGWTQYRDFPPFAEKPFRQLWKERQSQKPSSKDSPA